MFFCRMVVVLRVLFRCFKITEILSEHLFIGQELTSFDWSWSCKKQTQLLRRSQDWTVKLDFVGIGFSLELVIS